MANFLVTGGAGFIGSNLVEALLVQGHAVRILDDFSTGYRHNIAPFLDKIDVVEGSIDSLEDCNRAARDMDYVLHQGALPSVARSVADPALSHAINATGTLNVLTAARDAGVKRVVYASSSSIYGDQPVEYKHEALPMCPLSPYAAAKASGEHYLRAFSNCYNLETVSLRYFNVFGPRQDPGSAYSAVIPLFIHALLEGRSPQIHGDGLQARDFTYVENNVRANIQAATGDFVARGQVYNVACGASISLLDLVDALNGLLGTQIRPEHIASRVGDIRVSKADISRAQRELGYHVHVAFEDGLEKTVNWYLTQRAEG